MTLKWSLDSRVKTKVGNTVTFVVVCTQRMEISVRRALYQTAEMIRLWNAFHEKLGNEVQTTFDPAQW